MHRERNVQIPERSLRAAFEVLPNQKENQRGDGISGVEKQLVSNSEEWPEHLLLHEPVVDRLGSHGCMPSNPQKVVRSPSDVLIRHAD